MVATMSIRAVLRTTVGLLLTLVVMSVAGTANAAGNPDYTAPPPTVVVVTPGPRAPAPDPGSNRTVTPNTAAPGTATSKGRLTSVESESARHPATRQAETMVVDRTTRSRMPVTGSDVTSMLLAGLALTVAGGALLAIRRRFSGASSLA